MVKLKNDGVNR